MQCCNINNAVWGIEERCFEFPVRFVAVLRTRLVRAKIDQPNQMVHVTSAMHRTFTNKHWSNLHSLLTNWKSNLHTVREHVGQLAQMQMEMIRNKQI